MIAENEILDAVNRLLVEHWPDRTVYCNTIPQEFTRESFALLESFYKVEDGGPDCVEITAGYTILGYLPPDKRGNVDRLGLGILLRDMQDLFRCGYLPVSDRALRVTECSGSHRGGGGVFGFAADLLRQPGASERKTKDEASIHPKRDRVRRD